MEWITSILGIIGGGWGTFASILVGLIALGYLWYKYKQYLIDKAHKDTKDKEAKDHEKQIKDNQKDSAQSKKDEDLVEDLHEDALKDS